MEEVTTQKRPDVRVTMANTLNMATHNLTLVERRILILAISKLENKKYTGNPSIKISALEIAAHADITPEAAYLSAIKASKHLRTRSIPLLCDLVTGEPKKGHTCWVTTSYYLGGEGCIEVLINNELLPYLTELKREFTTYNHARTGGFRSLYSCRLFDQIMQHKSTGWRTLSIEQLGDILEVPKSLRSNFANMRNRAIEPAIKEIREKDGLPIKYSVVKKGRKIIEVKFTFPTEQRRKLNLSTSKPAPKKSKLTAEQIAKREAAMDAAAKAAGDEQMKQLLKKVNV